MNILIKNIQNWDQTRFRVMKTKVTQSEIEPSQTKQDKCQDWRKKQNRAKLNKELKVPVGLS